MSIDKNQVKKVAKLSRISLDDKNLESLSHDLASILKFVEQLNKLDTNNVKPLNSIVDKSLEARKDKVNDGKIKEEILKNSPDKNEDFFIVPKVVE
jgi:aspartyl-tRNA(Asn)/glutamyl-tRNA(Gln) amidotransferase subunit C|tara:strand:- start:204 stop:491 length:288 start_codon:yes stop_codon:yes gene_type:complete